jgi:hypothetical protein
LKRVFCISISFWPKAWRSRTCATAISMAAAAVATATAMISRS